MALFGGKKDIVFMSSINRELLYKLVDTEILFYKTVLDDVKINIYGESLDKVYYQPLRFPVWIDRQPTNTEAGEFGLDTSAQITIYVFKGTALQLNFLPEQGDIFQWDGKFYEIDNVSENKYVVGKNPDTWINGNEFGGSFQYECQSHMIRESQIQVLDIDYGTNFLDEYHTN